ncbi:hypothetical protein KR009_000744 [Drosophila setifemur]|nr:hypothetical protein KR009_000744 [Drosophila setifemur]
MCPVLFVLVFVGAVQHGNGIDAYFEETYPAHIFNSDQETIQHKRAADVPQFFDQASFSFDGLTRVASVPVPFPLDICILQLPAVKYATALHKDGDGMRHFAVYAWRPEEQDYQLLLQLPAPKAVHLDCLTFSGKGYVALSYNLTEPVQQAREGSPIYEVSPETGIRAVQYFSGSQLRGMYLRISSQELTLLQAFDSGPSDKQEQQQCPYFKWMGRSFQRLGSIPCSNARRLEAFGIDFTDYVAVANYADTEGRTATHSEIFRYDSKARRFQLFQQLRSNGAVDVKYFSLPVNEVSRRHFLILGNTIEGSSSEAGEANTVIYVFEKGQFVPYQRLSFFALERVLPVQHSVSEKFLLLVACNKQDVKIYNLNDWRFEESKVQFTEGALSRGVARMRSYEEGQQSYLVIANENMAANETNIFQPLYKQDEHANMLRQQIIEWAREQRKRLEQVNVEQLIQKLQEMLKTRAEKLQRSQIRQVKAKSFEDRLMKLTPNYWKALQYAKQALDVIERDALAAGSGRNPIKRSAEKPMVQHEFEEVTVDTLVVHGKVRAGRINGVDTENPVYESINASKVYVSEEYKQAKSLKKEPLLEELTVQDLQLQGRLNGLNWTQLQDQTLKRSGRDVQFVKAAVEISQLQSEAVQVNGNEVNDRPLGHLIPVDGGDFIVQQDVQFAQPIQVNRLLINQRLNHIHVDRQRFDVLIQEANHTQIIEGTKRFENVRVMEPITIAVRYMYKYIFKGYNYPISLQGQLMGAELRAMSPVKVTHKTLQLQGDFVIDGDATIGRLIQVGDLVDEPTQRSAAGILSRGLRLDQPLEDVNVNFHESLNANNTELSFLNTKDLQNLVQLNVDEVQVVEGIKTFPQSVEISTGFGEIKWLNGINLEELPEMLLTKSGNQTVGIPIQLQGLEIDQVNSSQVSLNGRELDDYLQISKDQKSNGSVFVNHLNTKEMNLDDLHLNGLLFGQSLSSIYAHGSKGLHSWHLPHDFNGSLHAQNVWINGNINGVGIAQMEQQLQQLAGNIKYVGDFSFGHAMNLSSLSFSSSLNGIQANQFGRCWLQSKGDQNFTAPQELASLKIKQGIFLRGQLNNFTLEDLVNRSYRLNASEHLQAVRFENPIVLQSELQVGQLNGLRVPEDVIYMSTGGHLSASVSIAGDLTVAEWCNISRLNGYPLDTLDKYLNGQLGDTFRAENVKFNGRPSYNRLNGHDLSKLLDQVWLDNEQIELRGVQMDSAYFKGLLELQGPINGRQVGHIKHNYLSRTRAGQRVKCAMSLLSHDVTFAQPPAAAFVDLRGHGSSDALVEGSGYVNLSLNFDEFVSNTLKTAGVHTISGQWKLPEASVSGNLNHVLVNKLYLVDDVLRLSKNNVSKSPPTTIEAPKIVSSASINRLYLTPSSQVALVPLAQWINDAVYIYGNHSIAGVTRLESIHLYNDLGVKGAVNGISWQPENLLLRDQEQHAQGSLLVVNSLPQQKRILSNNVENLWVDSINGLPVNDLLVNKAQNRPNLHVESQLVFTQPLTVGQYQVGNENGVLDPSYKWKRGVETNDIDHWHQLKENVDAVKVRLTKPPKVLENFALLQRLPHKSTLLEIVSSETEDLLVIWDRETNQTIYYTWQPEEHLFARNSSKLSLTQLSKQILKQTNEESLLPTKLKFSRLGFECLGLQDDNRILIKCLDKQNKSWEAILPRQDAKQILSVANIDDMPLLLSTPNGVELWKLSNGSYTLVRSLLDGKPVEQVALVQREASIQSAFLAILASAPAPEITIYRQVIKHFNNDGMSDLQLEQVLELPDVLLPHEMRFMQLPESGDLLLCVSNILPQQPLTIYQHRGAAGFQQILGQSALPEARSLKVIQLANGKGQMLSLTTEEAIYLLQPHFATL